MKKRKLSTRKLLLLSVFALVISFTFNSAIVSAEAVNHVKRRNVPGYSSGG